MADLNVEHGGPTDRVSTRGGDRGQILLIAAFTLAVTFVALALVVNSAIFTENLASRGEVAGSSEALTYQHQVEDSVADAMAYANRYEYGDPENSVRASVEAMGEQGANQQAIGGQLVDIEYNSTESEEGVRIADNASGGSTFENESTPVSDPNWKLAESVEGTRNVEITITDASDLSGGPASAFTLEANESQSWELRVWRNGEDMVVVDVKTPDDSDKCRVPASTPVDIDVTRGVVDGQRCHALTWNRTNGDQMWWGTGLNDEYEIWIKNGNRIRGNYSMFLRGDPNDEELVDGPAADDEPYHRDAIYKAAVDYLFRTSQVTYDTTIEVAPGETP